ncbi:MAG: 4-hydroxy-tetrahydrodipicolinate reductase [Steroidobacteraceae bacterium]|nr:4-hydroxy-tetrahydrodipicolinate reductase [Steroidobacteraceae bacterium]
MTRVVIVGGAGRMGRSLVACARDAGVEVGAVIASPHSATLGQDAGEMAGVRRLGVPITADLGAAIPGAQVVIDFSRPNVARDHVDQCALARIPLVLGTTGLDAGIETDFERAATRIALLVAANTSLGVTLLADLVARAARALPDRFDVTIVEAHHRGKKDAPSGTALALGRAVEGPAKRAVDYAVVRGGDIVGEHDVRFIGEGEELNLAHRATDRAIFARGALRAAVWLAGRPPGRYSMRDVLGIKSVS